METETVLKQRTAELEAELSAFKRENEELCKAVNNRKYRQLMNALLKKEFLEKLQ